MSTMQHALAWCHCLKCSKRIDFQNYNASFSLTRFMRRMAVRMSWLVRYYEPAL
jgi:hypothetical protein